MEPVSSSYPEWREEFALESVERSFTAYRRAMRLRTLIHIPPATEVRQSGTVNRMASAGS